MMRAVKYISVLISIYLLIIFCLPIKLNGQDSDRYIYLMRPRNFLGCGNKMDIQVNGQSIYKLKNARRLIIISDKLDTVYFQIIYPLMPKYYSQIIRILPDDKEEIYLEASFEGAGRGFRIIVSKLNASAGKEKFYIPGYFNDRNYKIKMIKMHSNRLYVALPVFRLKNV